MNSFIVWIRKIYEFRLKRAAINQLTPLFLAARSISTAIDKFGYMYEFTYNKESDRIMYEIHTIYDIMQKNKDTLIHFEGICLVGPRWKVPNWLRYTNIALWVESPSLSKWFNNCMGVMFLVLHPWLGWIETFCFSLHGLVIWEHGQKQILGSFNIWFGQWIGGHSGSACGKSLETILTFIGFMIFP